YYDLAFELMHKLFVYYVENNKIENIQLITSQYYDLYQKNNTEESTVNYYADMATFFLSTGEFNEAINYYNRIREISIENGIKNKSVYAYISYYQGTAYEKVGMLKESYEVIKESIKYIDNIEDHMDKGEIYHTFARLSIVLGKSDTRKYTDLAYKYQKDNPMALAISKGKNGECYFYVGDRVRAIEEILDGIKTFPDYNEERYVNFLNDCINTLYENGEYEKAYELIETALNMAINIEVSALMEEAYYLKGMILQKMGMHLQAEMYMNLSLDFILKCGTKEKMHSRYLNMAELYYNLNEPKDSLKYFTLAMKLEDKF
ncbi:MAG: transcriptional regulator, partial [Clostridium sp.]